LALRKYESGFGGSAGNIVAMSCFIVVELSDFCNAGSLSEEAVKKAGSRV
jgi:hypothetical protein